VLWKKAPVTETDPGTAQKVTREALVAKLFTVFNAEQADRLPETFLARAGQPVDQLPQSQQVGSAVRPPWSGSTRRRCPPPWPSLTPTTRTRGSGRKPAPRRKEPPDVLQPAPPPPLVPLKLVVSALVVAASSSPVVGRPFGAGAIIL